MTIKIARGLTAAALKVKSSVKTRRGRHVEDRRQADTEEDDVTSRWSASVGERDYTSTGCQSPLTPFAPAGCVSATLSPWSAKSIVVKIKR